MLSDSISAELRWWVIHNADGLAAVTITTYAGRTIDGTLAWEDIEPHAVSIAVGGRTTVLRPGRIESFTLDHTATHRRGQREHRKGAGRPLALARTHALAD